MFLTIFLNIKHFVKDIFFKTSLVVNKNKMGVRIATWATFSSLNCKGYSHTLPSFKFT